jgi:hypothetical protein
MSDEFNFDGKPSRQSTYSGPGMEMWDILSILVLVITGVIVFYFLAVFMFPNSNFNILPPGGRGIASPTNTPEPIKLDATWTPSPTLELTPSNTPIPTWTVIPSNTPFSLVPPTKTPKPTNTPKAPFGSLSVTNVESTLIHPELGCNWAGIGGTVVDLNNSPVIGMVVVLRGSLDGKTIEQQTVTGINKEYGPSGYEFVLSSAPIASSKTLYVQLVDLQNIPLSEKVFVTTSTDCGKNLVLVRFKKNR